MKFRNPRNQRFERAEQNHLRRQNKWGVKFLVVFVSVLVIGCVYEYNFGKPVKEVKKYQVSVPMIKTVEAERKPDYEANAKKLKQDVLDDLSIRCETKDFIEKGKDPDGAIIFDSNNEASIGRFQFQRATVIYYYEKFYGKKITNSEAIAIAIDKIKATELAEKILFLDKGKGAENWHNCNKKMSISDKVDMLKKLETI